MPLTTDQTMRLFDFQDRNNTFEMLIEKCYSEILHPGDSAIDGGAHVGMHTLPMARLVGAAGAVFAFEAIEPLADTVAYNARDLPQVQVFNRALAQNEGQTTFHLMSDEPWLSGIARRFQDTDKPVTVLIVKTFVLDALSDQPVRFIKLDLEGGEYHALRGATHLLRRQQPVVVLECGRADAAAASGYSQADYFSLFEDIGYQLHDLFGHPFTEAEFPCPWNDRHVPHYLVASPKELRGVQDRLERNALRALE